MSYDPGGKPAPQSAGFSDAGGRADAGLQDRGERLRRAVRASGGNEAVAARAGVPLSTLGTYIAGGEWKLSRALALAAACGVSLDWLATGRGAMAGDADGGPAAPAGLVAIPRLEPPGPAGGDVLRGEERGIGQVAFDEAWLRRLGMRGRNLAAVEARGDGMAPTIRHGDMLIVDVSVRHFAYEAIYLLRLNEGVLIKRVHARPAGAFLLRGDNDRYGEYLVGAEEWARIAVLGQVIWHGGLAR